MSNQARSSESKVDKKQITAMAIFVLTNIPDTDEFTLRKFLELMNTTGGFGSISGMQLQKIIKLMKKYIPDTCNYSLNVLLEHLGAFFQLDEQEDPVEVAQQRKPQLIDFSQQVLKTVPAANGRDQSQGQQRMRSSMGNGINNCHRQLNDVS